MINGVKWCVWACLDIGQDRVLKMYILYVIFIDFNFAVIAMQWVELVTEIKSCFIINIG